MPQRKIGNKATPSQQYSKDDNLARHGLVGPLAVLSHTGVAFASRERGGRERERERAREKCREPRKKLRVGGPSPCTQGDCKSAHRVNVQPRRPTYVSLFFEFGAGSANAAGSFPFFDALLLPKNDFFSFIGVGDCSDVTTPCVAIAFGSWSATDSAGGETDFRPDRSPCLKPDFCVAIPSYSFAREENARHLVVGTTGKEGRVRCRDHAAIEQK